MMRRTVENLMRHYGCSANAARIYMDFREEGYPAYQAAIMAGIADPDEPPEEPEQQAEGRS
jgi:hypothetical protein